VRLCYEGVHTYYMKGVSLVTFVFILAFIARLRVYISCSRKRFIVRCDSLLSALV
jgi:hypothetical protein